MSETFPADLLPTDNPMPGDRRTWDLSQHLCAEALAQLSIRGWKMVSAKSFKLRLGPDSGERRVIVTCEYAP